MPIAPRKTGADEVNQMGFIAPVSNIPTLGDVEPVASALSERSRDILRVGRDRFAMIVPFGRFTAGVTNSGIVCAAVCSGRCQPGILDGNIRSAVGR